MSYWPANFHQIEFDLDLLGKLWTYRKDCINNKRTPENSDILDKFEDYTHWYYDKGLETIFKKNQFSSRTSAWNSFIKYYEERVRGNLFTGKNFLLSGDDDVFKLRRKWEDIYKLPKSKPIPRIGGSRRKSKSRRTRRIKKLK